MPPGLSLSFVVRADGPCLALCVDGRPVVFRRASPTRPRHMLFVGLRLLLDAQEVAAQFAVWDREEAR